MQRFFLVALLLLTVAAVEAPVAELYQAVRDGDIQRVTRLLKEQPELARARTADGRWPVFLLGAQRVETNMAELFLAHGADVKQTNSEGRTALHLAAKSGSI